MDATSGRYEGKRSAREKAKKEVVVAFDEDPDEDDEEEETLGYDDEKKKRPPATFSAAKRVPSAVRLAARLRSARLISPTQRSIIVVTRSVSITPRLPLFLLLAFASASASNAAGSMSCRNLMKLRGAAEDVWLDTMSGEERVQLNLMEKAPAATKTIAGRLTTVGGFQPSKEMLLISISRSNKIAKGFMDGPVLSVSMGEPPSCAM